MNPLSTRIIENSRRLRRVGINPGGRFAIALLSLTRIEISFFATFICVISRRNRAALNIYVPFIVLMSLAVIDTERTAPDARSRSGDEEIVAVLRGAENKHLSPCNSIKDEICSGFKSIQFVQSKNVDVMMINCPHGAWKSIDGAGGGVRLMKSERRCTWDCRVKYCWYISVKRFSLH